MERRKRKLRKTKIKTVGDAAEAFSPEELNEFNPGEVLDQGWNKKRKPDRWRPITENVYVYPACREMNIPPYEWQQCDCNFFKGGCGEDCVNRRLQMECAIGFCRGGAPIKCTSSISLTPKKKLQQAEHFACANTVLQSCTYPPCDIFETIDNRGFGLRCMIDVSAGKPIGEYRGEIITTDELQSRRKNIDPNAAFYTAALGDGLFIDAQSKGAYARFANHSCQPNCELQKWTLGNEIKLLLVTTQYVPALTELTYNYNAGGGVTDITQHQVCKCGATNCSGKIGGKTLELAKKIGKTKPKKKKKTKKTKPKPLPKPVDGQNAKTWALHTLNKLTQNSKYPVAIENAPLELCVRLESAAERAKAHFFSRRARHCFCRLPESISLPTPCFTHFSSKKKNQHNIQIAHSLVCCDACSKWFHACCIRLTTLPNDSFLCPICSSDQDTLKAIALSAKRNQPRVWRRTLRANATLADATAAFDAAPKDECLRDAKLALEFLDSIIQDVSTWIIKAQQILHDVHALSITTTAALRPLAELICQGHMLEFTDRKHAKLMADIGNALDNALDALPSSTTNNIEIVASSVPFPPLLSSNIVDEEHFIEEHLDNKNLLPPPTSVEVISESSSGAIPS